MTASTAEYRFPRRRFSSSFRSLLVLAAGLAITAIRPAPCAAGPVTVIWDCQVKGSVETVKCGRLMVPEDRARPLGRSIPITFAVIPARNPESREGPLFEFGGGPGQTASERKSRLLDDWRRIDHDLVLVDIRGTADGGRMDCPAERAADSQYYLQSRFTAAFARACRKALEKRFDLTQYSSLEAARDIDAVRHALGYESINLEEYSYGTYLAVIYAREFPRRVRTIFLGSIMLPANRVPLHLASDAQEALDATLGECEADPACSAAFPTVRDDFYGLLARLAHAPIPTQVHDGQNSPIPVTISRAAFADAVRVMLYSAKGGRSLPFLIDRAKRGDLSAFAETAVSSNRALYDDIRFGLFFSITCSEFVSRIRPGEIQSATAATFLGETRVRSQIAACTEWPRTRLPKDFFRPFVSAVPAVLASFSLDNYMSARWSGLAKQTFPNSVMLHTRGGHSAQNDCADEALRELLRTASAANIDLSCSASVKLPPFQLPGPGDTKQ